jgi:hypothetical protein
MTIDAMKLFRSKNRRSRLDSAGMELAGALSIASQMALLSPPGFDEWVRCELCGDTKAARHETHRHARRR